METVTNTHIFAGLALLLSILSELSSFIGGARYTHE